MKVISTQTQEQDEDPHKPSSSTTTAFGYMPPFWSEAPKTNKEQYYLEVVKEGTIIDKIQLGHKPFYLFGRAPTCDIVAEHPVGTSLFSLLPFIRHFIFYTHTNTNTNKEKKRNKC
jgi:hypothetical protein